MVTQPHAVDVRFGSIADIATKLGDVRFTPESGQVHCNSPCRLRAKSRHVTECRPFLSNHCLRPLDRLRWTAGAPGREWRSAGDHLR